MSAEELTEGCFRARRRFNGWPSIARRALDIRGNCRNPRNLGAYIVSNAVSRREIHRKQGMPLGEPEPLPGERAPA